MVRFKAPCSESQAAVCAPTLFKSWYEPRPMPNTVEALFVIVIPSSSGIFSAPHMLQSGAGGDGGDGGGGGGGGGDGGGGVGKVVVAKVVVGKVVVAKVVVAKMVVAAALLMRSERACGRFHTSTGPHSVAIQEVFRIPVAWTFQRPYGAFMRPSAESMCRALVPSTRAASLAPRDYGSILVPTIRSGKLGEA